MSHGFTGSIYFSVFLIDFWHTKAIISVKVVTSCGSILEIFNRKWLMKLRGYLKYVWVKVFKNRPSKTCARQPLKVFTWSTLVYLDPYVEPTYENSHVYISKLKLEPFTIFGSHDAFQKVYWSSIFDLNYVFTGSAVKFIEKRIWLSKRRDVLTLMWVWGVTLTPSWFSLNNAKTVKAVTLEFCSIQ